MQTIRRAFRVALLTIVLALAYLVARGSIRA